MNFSCYQQTNLEDVRCSLDNCIWFLICFSLTQLCGWFNRWNINWRQLIISNFRFMKFKGRSYTKFFEANISTFEAFSNYRFISDHVTDWINWTKKFVFSICFRVIILRVTYEINFWKSLSKHYFSMSSREIIILRII